MKLRSVVIVVLGTLAGAPAMAESDNDELRQELRRLAQRVGQLETANHRLQADLANRSTEAARERELAARLEDVESHVLSMEKKSRLLDAVDGISAEASLTMVAQRATSGAVSGMKSQANYRGDVEVTLPGGEIGDAEGLIFAHVRLGQGNGLAPMSPTYTATPNSTAFQLTNGDDSAALLAQAWYQLDVPMGGGRGEAPSRLEATVGKIDPFIFFDQNNIADDESAAFLNNAFVHNPLLDSGGDAGVDAYGFTPGVRLAYRNDSQSPDYWQASLGLFGSGPGASFDGSFDKPFVIGQVEVGRQFIEGFDGTYRLYAWSNGRATAYDGMTEERHSGWGLSVDQYVAEHASVFARYGHSTRGRVRFDRAFTLGAELGGSYWGREHDRLGFAAGWLKTSDGYHTDDPDGYGPSGAERLAEFYYAWSLNDHLEISPDLQWITRPGGDGSAKGLTVVGLRAKASF